MIFSNRMYMSDQNHQHHCPTANACSRIAGNAETSLRFCVSWRSHINENMKKGSARDVLLIRRKDVSKWLAVRWQHIICVYSKRGFVFHCDIHARGVGPTVNTNMLYHVITGMILYTIRRGLYSYCQEVISMHKVYLSSRCLLMETNYIDGGRAKDYPTAINDYFTDRFPSIPRSKFLLKGMSGKCYDDCNVAAKRTAASEHVIMDAVSGPCRL